MLLLLLSTFKKFEKNIDKLGMEYIFLNFNNGMDGLLIEKGNKINEFCDNNLIKLNFSVEVRKKLNYFRNLMEFNFDEDIIKNIFISLIFV